MEIRLRRLLWGKHRATTIAKVIFIKPVSYWLLPAILLFFPITTHAKSYSKEEVKGLIVSYSKQYGIDPKAPLCIAYHESGYNHMAKNKRSTASGAFQYLKGTWRGTDEAKIGKSVFDADANVKAAIKYMSSRGNAKPWAVRHKCPPISVLRT